MEALSYIFTVLTLSLGAGVLGAMVGMGLLANWRSAPARKDGAILKCLDRVTC
jgi:hypothetical protein